MFGTSLLDLMSSLQLCNEAEPDLDVLDDLGRDLVLHSIQLGQLLERAGRSPGLGRAPCQQVRPDGFVQRPGGQGEGLPRLEYRHALVDGDEGGLVVTDVEDEAVLEAEAEQGHQMGRGHQNGEDLKVVEKKVENKYVSMTHKDIRTKE